MHPSSPIHDAPTCRSSLRAARRSANAPATQLKREIKPLFFELRAFARALAYEVEYADHLVEGTIIRALWGCAGWRLQVELRGSHAARVRWFCRTQLFSRHAHCAFTACCRSEQGKRGGVDDIEIRGRLHEERRSTWVGDRRGRLAADPSLGNPPAPLVSLKAPQWRVCSIAYIAAEW